MKLPHGADYHFVFHELACYLDADWEACALLDGSANLAAVNSCVFVVGFVLLDQSYWDMASGKLHYVLESGKSQLVDCVLCLAVEWGCEWHGW